MASSAMLSMMLSSISLKRWKKWYVAYQKIYLSNYRLISKLSFLPKVLEKVVFNLLQTHVKDVSVWFLITSYERNWSLKTFNDLLLTVNSGNSAVLVLVDSSAPFDIVDRNILL